MRILIFLSVLLILILPSEAGAARIELVNGDRISGQLVAEDADTVIFKSSYGGDMQIPRNQIASYYADSGVATPLPVKASPPLPEASKPASEKGFLGAQWKGRVDAGAGLQTGNTDQKSLNADFETKAKWETDRANLDVDYNWEESEKERTQDNRAVAGNYDRFLDPKWLGDDKWYINYNANLRQDKVADLELRSVAGVGLGRQFYETDDTYLSASLGPSWLRQKFYGEDTDSSIAARWNIDYDQKFYDDLFSLFHKHSLYLPTNNLGGYIFDAESGVRIPLKRGFTATAEWQLNINNDPGPEADTEDSIYSLKLGYEW